MSVRPFSKEFTQFGFLWLKKKKLPITPKAFDAPSYLKESSLSLLPPSVESLLYRVIVIF